MHDNVLFTVIRMYYIKTTIKHKTQKLNLELFRKHLHSVFPLLKFLSIMHFAKIIFAKFRTVKLTFPTHVQFPDFGFLPAINLSHSTMSPFKLCSSFCILLELELETFIFHCK